MDKLKSYQSCTQERELEQGWLSPTGEFFKCNSYDHIEKAKELAENLNLPDIDSKTGRIISADDQLLFAGWVYIGISVFLCHEWRVGWHRSLSQEQIQFLRPYFEQEDIPMNSFCKTHWEEELQEH